MRKVLLVSITVLVCLLVANVALASEIGPIIRTSSSFKIHK